MAKLITKFKFLKPNTRQSVGGYAKYIATREGVEKIDESFKLELASQKQQQLLARILKDFPDSKTMLEYEDYKSTPNKGNASEFITRALEDNAYEVMRTKTYADYIATRPRAERFGTHGLFTDDGVAVKLGEVSEDLNHYGGNVWTVIISLRREDAERLGFNTGERWRDMLRTQTEALSKNFKIPLKNLKWYGAFHNESHHPHIHLMVYADEGVTPYLSKQGVNNLRSAFAKDIFAQDLLCVYEKQTEHRDSLRMHSRELIEQIVEKINSGTYDNPKLEAMLTELADRLSKTSGKKQYGYLKADVKAIVNNIVSALAADDRIATLYELWYEQKEEVIRTYTEELPQRIPLVDNPEFKSIKNAVISEAMNIVLNRLADDETKPIYDADDTEPDDGDDYGEYTYADDESAMWEYYQTAKIQLDRNGDGYNPSEAVRNLIQSAKLGCGVAKYRLGKLFLDGEDVEKDVDYALRWLEESADEENPYAEYLLGKLYLKGEDVEQDLPRAEDLLKHSSEKNNRYAKYTLGKAMLDGTLPIDIDEVIELLTQSAICGFAPAQYLFGKLLYQGELVPQDLESAVRYLEMAAGEDIPNAAYLLGKILLTEETVKDILRAIKNLEIAAESGNAHAEYLLGKLYLFGKEIQQDYDKALEYLTASADHGNQYAKQLLNSLKNNRNPFAAMGIIRLLNHISRIIQNHLEDEQKDKAGAIDRKLRRKIDEKKQAHGLKQ